MTFDTGPDLIILLIITGILFLPIVVLVLVVVFAVNAVRRVPSQPVTWGQGPSQPAAQDPRAILGERLAKGEISQDEFDTAMRALGYGGPPPPA